MGRMEPLSIDVGVVQQGWKIPSRPYALSTPSNASINPNHCHTPRSVRLSPFLSITNFLLLPNPLLLYHPESSYPVGILLVFLFALPILVYPDCSAHKDRFSRKNGPFQSRLFVRYFNQYFWSRGIKSLLNSLNLRR